MFLWLLDYLTYYWGDVPLEAFDKITFRAALAVVISFLLAVMLGPWMIAWLRRRFREPIKSDSPEVCRLHSRKQFTPTMGGLFIVSGLIAAVLLFGDLSNRYLLTTLLLVGSLALIGVIDDIVKLRGSGNGISARGKMAGQVAVATAWTAWQADALSLPPAR